MKKIMMIMAMMVAIATSACANTASAAKNDKYHNNSTVVVYTPHGSYGVATCASRHHVDTRFSCCNGRHDCHFKGHKMCKACKKEYGRQIAQCRHQHKVYKQHKVYNKQHKEMLKHQTPGRR